MREMREGDYYKLDIAKPRLIRRIKLICKEDSYPEAFQLQIRQDDNHQWENIGTYNSEDGSLGYMEVSFAKRRKLKGLNFIITKPRMEPGYAHGQSPAWSIFDIQLTEVRLFGRWWERVIGR